MSAFSGRVASALGACGGLRDRFKNVPCFRIGDFSLRAGLRQLPERVYLPLALGLVGGRAALGLPQVQAAHRLL